MQNIFKIKNKILKTSIFLSFLFLLIFVAFSSTNKVNAGTNCEVTYFGCYYNSSTNYEQISFDVDHCTTAAVLSAPNSAENDPTLIGTINAGPGIFGTSYNAVPGATYALDLDEGLPSHTTGVNQYCNPMTGTLSATDSSGTPTSSCTISAGNSSCNVNLSWATTPLYPVYNVYSAVTANGMTSVSGNSGGPTAFTVPYGGRTFYLYNTAHQLATTSVSATCASGTTWDSTDGVCGYTVAATAGTGGTITPASQIVDSGSTATLTVTPSGGYNINTVTGCNGSGSSTYTTGIITANCTVSATFTPVAVLIPALSAGWGDSIGGSAGQTITLTPGQTTISPLDFTFWNSAANGSTLHVTSCSAKVISGNLSVPLLPLPCLNLPMDITAN